MSSDQRFAIIIAVIPITALLLSWFLKRLVSNYDRAMNDRQNLRDQLEEERQARMARHTQANHEAITALNLDLVKSTKDLSDRLVHAQETFAASLTGMAVKLAHIEGHQEGKREVWDGIDRRTRSEMRTGT